MEKVIEEAKKALQEYDESVVEEAMHNDSSVCSR